MLTGSPQASLPFISIVITSYNYGHYLHDAIESALSQDYPCFEVVVTDNASTDDSWQIISSFSSNERLRTHRHESNIGAKANYDFGFDLARGDYVAFLSADDFFLPGHIRRLSEMVVRRPDVDLPYTDYITIDESGRISRRVPHPGSLPASYVDMRNEFAELFAHGPYHNFGTTMLRRNLFDEVGRTVGYLTASDFEFLVRLARLGRKFSYVDVPSIVFRNHSASMSGEAFVRSGSQVLDYLSIFEEHALPEMPRLRGYERAIGRHLDWRLANAARYPEAQQVARDNQPRILAIRDALEKNVRDRRIVKRPSSPRISVIVPTVDRLALLDDALRSIAGQDCDDWEIVIVGDAGTDLQPYLEHLDFYSRIRYVRLTKKVGIGAARNLGARLARAEIVCFLDDDDILGPTHLSSLSTTIQAGADVAYVGASLQIDDYDEATVLPRKVLARNIRAFADGSDAATLLEVANTVPLCAAALRRQCIDQTGGFGGLPLLESWEFLLRMKRAYGMRFVDAPGTHVSQRLWLRGQLLGANINSYPAAMQAVYTQHVTSDPHVARLRERHAEGVLTALRTTTHAALGEIEGATTFATTLSGCKVKVISGATTHGT
jgi:glycosyltransferase involved in cell wall biosynthesis